METWLTDEVDRATAARGMRLAISRTSIGASIIYGLFLLVGAVGVRPEFPRWIVVVQLALVVAIALRARRPGLDLRELHALLYGFTVVGSASVVYVTWLLRDLRESYFLAFYVLGVAAIAVARTSALIVMTSVGAASIALAMRMGGPQEATWSMVSTSTSYLLGIAILLGRRHHLADLAAARAEERKLAGELRGALDRLETELAERKRAEAKRAELEAQLWQARKLEAIGAIAGGVAHDINNVLAAVVSVAEVAREEAPEDGQTRADFDQILAAANRGADFTRNLLGFARRGKVRHVAFRLDEVVDEVLGLFERTPPRGVRFVLERSEREYVVTGDPGQMHHVVTNLCLHASQTSAENGTVRVRLGRELLAPGASSVLHAGGRFVTLEVVDEGPGMDRDALAHAFEPYAARASGSARKAGLGLAMIYGAMREHAGEITLESELGRGTRALLRFPSDEAGDSTSAPPSSSTRTTSGEILVIDDDPFVRRAIRRILEGAGRRCVLAANADEGLTCFDAAPASFAAVVLDLAMPGMNGAECFVRLRGIDREVPILIASGYPEDQGVQELLDAGQAAFVHKPFGKRELLTSLERLSRRPLTSPASSPSSSTRTASRPTR